jgi:hypothetical protein
MANVSIHLRRGGAQCGGVSADKDEDETYVKCEPTPAEVELDAEGSALTKMRKKFI